MSELRKIQDYVQQIAEAISAALKVVVEIIDDQHYRVGGSHQLKKNLGEKQKRGYVNDYVLKTRQHFIMTNPGYHQLCNDCDLQGNCYCTAGLFCPINLRGESKGIISLMGFNEDQKDTLLNNSEYYMEFIVHMADLLATKISEQQMMEDLSTVSSQLNTIINTVSYGIVAVDKQGKITCFNQAAEKLLGLKSSEVAGKPVTGVMPASLLPEVLATGKVFSERQVSYHETPARATVLSNAYPIFAGRQIVGAVESFRNYAEVHKLAYRLASTGLNYTFENIVGTSPRLLEVVELARRVACGGLSTVLIEGESGTGKELFARAIHAESPHARGPFIPVNCSAIPDALFESELFGYVEGAFTGAKHGGKLGKFELADGGTVFLDEIGDMPLYLQAKLLRVLQERVIERLGSAKQIPINVRLIAATNRNLAEMVERGEFREDLFYRLSVIPILIPPLRERKEDLELLLDHYLFKYNRLLSKQIKGFDSGVKAHLADYHWPGNVRELENMVEYAVNMAGGSLIGPGDLPVRLRRVRQDDSGRSVQPAGPSPKAAERAMLAEMLQRFGTSVKGKDRIAAELGISRATLYRRLREMGLLAKSK